MKLSELISGEHQVIQELESADRWGAIDELTDILVQGGAIREADRKAILDEVRKRESSMSTGIGFGIGIPHASTDLIDEAIGAIGRSKEGINFDALDNQPVTLVVLFLVPKGQFQKHLHTLANIAKRLHNPEFRKSLEEAPDAKAMLDIIRQPVE
jgi:mannitol/fructose-specific phosphotransferase system IIA component (Ntr-type)|tara:strand:+ start:228 stop:692 length:465 start_codon:yes stop_codon:yes gene_type:complete